jgi:hypothetical protein
VDIKPPDKDPPTPVEPTPTIKLTTMAMYNFRSVLIMVSSKSRIFSH